MLHIELKPGTVPYHVKRPYHISVQKKKWNAKSPLVSLNAAGKPIGDYPVLFVRRKTIQSEQLRICGSSINVLCKRFILSLAFKTFFIAVATTSSSQKYFDAILHIHA
jgi:hypothetical protein